MFRVLLVALMLLGSGAAFAHDGSLDYPVSDGGRYCEFHFGQRVPAGLKPYKTWRRYREPSYYVVMRDYRACKGRVRVEILAENAGVEEINIVEPGICAVAAGRKICIGETLATAHRRFPDIRMGMVEEEGSFFVANLSPVASLLIDNDSLQSDPAQKYCTEMFDDKCFHVLGGQKITGIGLVKPA